MAIIYSYPVITSLANDDRLIISDMDSTTGNPTKSVALSTLKSFISGTPGAGGVSGAGTTNKIPLWTNGPSGVIGDSLLQQDVGGTEVQLTGNLSMKANDLLDVNGETGTAGQLLSSLGISEFFYLSTRWVSGFYFLEFGIEPHTATLMAEGLGFAVFLGAMNLGAKFTKLH